MERIETEIGFVLVMVLNTVRAKGLPNAMLHQEEQEELYILSLSQLDPR